MEKRARAKGNKKKQQRLKGGVKGTQKGLCARQALPKCASPRLPTKSNIDPGRASPPPLSSHDALLGCAVAERNPDLTPQSLFTTTHPLQKGIPASRSWRRLHAAALATGKRAVHSPPRNDPLANDDSKSNGHRRVLQRRWTCLHNLVLEHHPNLCTSCLNPNSLFSSCPHPKLSQDVLAASPPSLAIDSVPSRSPT